MSYDIHSLFPFGTVGSVSSQNSTTLVIVLGTGQGAVFAVNQQVILTAQNQIPSFTTAMVGRITGISTDTLTIDITAPNREGSSQLSVSAGWTVRNGPTPKVLTDIETNTVQTSSVGVPSGIAQLDSGGLIPVGQLRLYNVRGPVAGSTTYNRGDLISYRGKRVVATSTFTTGAGTAPFISGANYITVSGDASVYASDFGVVGDASTDCTAFLQNALNYVSALGGGQVILPGGTIVVSSTIELPFHVWIRGQGKFGTLIKLATNANCNVIKNHVSSNGTGDPNGSYVGVLDLTIDGNAKNQNGGGTYHGIVFSTNPLTSAAAGDDYFDMNHIVQNVRVYRTTGDGVHMTGRSAIQLEAVISDQCFGYGFYSTFDTNFTHCEASNCGLDGFFISNNSVRLAACKAYLSGQLNLPGFITPISTSAGYHITSTAGVAIAACEAQNNSAQGFFFDGSGSAMGRVSMAACVADGNNMSAGTYSGVELNNCSYSNFQFVSQQGKQGGVQIGNQSHGLLIGNSSAFNNIQFTHSSYASATIGSNLDAASVTTNNSIVVNGLSITNTMAILTDVNFSGLSDLQVPTWNAATGKWINSDASSGLFAAGLLGDGSDGTIVMDGAATFSSFATKSGSTYTLTRDVLANALTINNTVTLFPNGYKIFCLGTVTNNGIISADGNAGNNNGTAGAATPNGTLAGGIAGGAGNTGNGSASSNTASACIGTGNGGAGGAGATGSAGAATNSANSTPFAIRSAQCLATGVVAYFLNVRPLGGAPGGGGGGGDGSVKGGGGGSGGGFIGILAKNFTNGATGVISAKGGNGGSPASGNSGGGGGGGGGYVAIYTIFAMVNSGSITLTGGTAGTGSGTGGNGVNGGNGSSTNNFIMN